MHESSLANAIAATIRSRGWEGRNIRIRVAGGHTDLDAFERSLITHLRISAPALDSCAFTVVHEPLFLTCSRCASTFRGLPSASCPMCGGPPLPTLEPEGIELEVDDGESG